MRRMFSICSLLVFIFALIGLANVSNAGVVEIKSHQLWIDGNPEPQLYGVEIEYFRLGAEAPNLPKEKVLDRWNKALERAYGMGANAISFAIPWDFHEYAPGRFDFDGSIDEDGDGRADYPARDLIGFLDLIESYGFRHVLVRPGPYIDSDWGVTGVAAVPEWFRQRYPNSHMRNAKGQRLAGFSYIDSNFRTHVERWLTALYQNVLINYIGEGRPVSFIQLDGESLLTRYALDVADFNPAAIAGYRKFLRNKYGTIAKLNAAHGRSWKNFESVEPPRAAGVNLAEDKDWYLFHDHLRTEYLKSLRRTWEKLGVTEPQVLFLAPEGHDSVENALLANYGSQRKSVKTAFMSLNLSAVLNRPFKTDHDIKAVESATDRYLGQTTDWTIGTIRAGSLRTNSQIAKAHLINQLSSFAGGVKALFIRDFHDGPNWKGEWIKKRISPWLNELRKDPRFVGLPIENLPDAFWRELNQSVAKKLFAGIDARTIFKPEANLSAKAAFALDREAEPTSLYEAFKEIGERVVTPHGALLGESVSLSDPVCILMDPELRFKKGKQTFKPSELVQDWSAGLIGLLLESNLNPRIVHWGLTPYAELNSCRLYVIQDLYYGSGDLVRYLKTRVEQGAGVMSFIGTQIFKALVPDPSACRKHGGAPNHDDIYQCTVGKGRVYRQGPAVYPVLNSSQYAKLKDISERRSIVSMAVSDLKIKPKLEIVPGNETSTRHAVAVGRVSQDGERVFVTVKNAGPHAFRGKIRWADADPNQTYSVTRLMDDIMAVYKGKELIEKGFFAGVSPVGVESFVIMPTPMLPQNRGDSSNSHTR